MKESQDFSALYQVADYRSFLQSYISIRKMKLSDFARAAGCTRGFPSDILIGRRRLTSKSYPSFEQAFKLPTHQKKLFQLLVAKEEPDIFTHIDPSTIDAKIKTIKESSAEKSRRATLTADPANPDFFNRVLENPFAMTVLSSTGDPETGATRQQIQHRTRLPDTVLDKLLTHLQECRLLRFENDRFFTQNMHLFFQVNSTSETLYRLFSQATKTAEKRLANINEGTDEFFFTSQFCIQENQMPHFKQELKDLILKFIDDSISSDGNRVVKLLTSLHF